VALNLTHAEVEAELAAMAEDGHVVLTGHARDGQPLYKLSPWSDVAGLYEAPEVERLADEIEEQRRIGRPGFPARPLIALTCTRRAWRGQWEPMVRTVEQDPLFARACRCLDRAPSVYACYRFEDQHDAAITALCGLPRERRWTHAEIASAMQQWRSKFGAWPTANEWNPAAIRDPQRRRECEQRRRAGGYPSTRTVQEAFDCWSAGLYEAKRLVLDVRPAS
jgi:hypothetical protein